MPRVDVGGGDLGEHRGEQQVVHLGDQSHVGALLELTCDRGAAETPADDSDAPHPGDGTTSYTRPWCN